MRNKLFQMSLFFFSIGMLAEQNHAQQVWTEDNKTTLVYQLAGGWNMQANETWWGYTLGSSVLPSGFNIDNIIESSIFIDADPVSGKPASATPFYRLRGAESPRPAESNSGGLFFLDCTSLPQCAVNMSRGSSGPTGIPNSIFQSASYSSTTAPRVYVKLEYLNLNGAPSGQTVNDYYYPINNWNMMATATTAPYTKTIVLPNLDISKIANVSVTILSDPVSSKVQVNYFDRKGFNDAGFSLTSRGGVIDIAPNGTGSQVTLTIQQGMGSGGNNGNTPNCLFATSSYTGSGLRGWIKVTYNGTATGIPQPYAVKSKFEQIGSWPISVGSQYQANLDLPFTNLGVAGNRLVYEEATIHSDVINSGDEHYVTSLRKKSYYDGGIPDVLGLFTIDEAANKIHLYAYSEYGDGGYFTSKHANGAGYSRGWFRVDYLAAACSDGTTGGFTSAFLGYTPDPTNDCHGNYGTPNVVHVIQNKASDIWNGSDQCAFTYKTETASNFTAVVRVDNQENTSGWAKAGVMFRTGLAANSPEVSLLVTPANGAQLTVRYSTGGATTHPYTNTQKAPLWLKLTKVGSVYTAYTSVSGDGFTQLGSPITVTTPSTYYTGLAATSNSSEFNTSVFSNVSF